MRRELPAASECPVCASVAPMRREVALRYGAIHRCAACGSGVLLPRPDAGALLALHSSDSYLSHPYFDARRAAAPSLQATFDARLRSLERRIGALAGKRLLDIGCDTGLFVEHAERAAGIRAVGIDIFDRVVERGRAAGLDLRCGTVEEVGFGDGDFDAVCAYDVIEHVESPARWSETVARILRPGGTLVVETPNFAGAVYAAGRLLGRVAGGEGPLRTLLERLWPPFHVQYFTAASLRGLLRRSGFDEIDVGGRELAPGETAVGGALRPVVLGAFAAAAALGRHTLLTAAAVRAAR